MTVAWLERVRAVLRAFRGSRAGAIAPMFALLAVPMVLSIGVAVDVGRAVTSRNNLQDALDATGLAISHLPATTPLATVTGSANAWLVANLHDKSISTPTLTVSTSATAVTLTASANVTTTLGGLAGISTVPINATSVIKWGLSHIELALVLDNTGSMADDSKLTSLTSAATTLVSTLAAQVPATDPTALKIGVVPFSMTVNIGSANQGAAWLTGTMPANYGANGTASTDIFTTSANRFTLLSKMGVAWGGCVEDRPMPYDVQDTAPTASVPGSMFVPFFAPDEPDVNPSNSKVSTAVASSSTKTTTTYNIFFQPTTTTTTTYTYYNNFANNYLADGVTNTDYQTEQGSSAKYTKTPTVGVNSYWGDAKGPNSGCQTAPLLRMTTNMAAVTTELGTMIAKGDTEIPVGLVWGWHLLSPNAPFADGVAYGTANTTKIVVLVTDGNNTYANSSNNTVNSADNSYYTALGYIWQNRISTDAGSFTDPPTALDNRLATLCTNMKAQNIVIYTVPVEVTDSGIQTLLQNCASSSADYINVTASSQLAAAFANIAGSIGHLRIAQ
jgi:Flp pilus assembly protein TadG